ncbi:hypothetical protein HDU91_006362, partial [Kappamyces sp. JEL0680]
AIKKLPHAKLLTGSEGKDQYDDKITHMISPPETKTLKTLAATLSGAWIIQDPAWVTNSLAQKKWLDETAYGFQIDPNPFRGLALYKDPSFEAVSKERKGAQGWPGFVDLLWVKCSGGRLVDSAEEADYVMVGDESKHRDLHPQSQTLDWFKFMAMIPSAAQF